MKVLYANHTSEFSGGERSLLALVEALPDSVERRLATPDGRLAEEARRLGISAVGIPATAGSLRLHPMHTPRALLQLARAGVALRRAAGAFGASLIHANSIRTGIELAISRPRLPTVVHVRDCLPPGKLSSASFRMISATATTIVANSEYTARSVREAAPKARVEVVHNPVDLNRFDPAHVDGARARASLAEGGDRSLLLGVVAQLTPWKGQDTAIEALRLIREEGVDAHLLLIGSAKFIASSTRHDNRAYVDGLKRRVAEAGLDDRVSWLGERDDVPELTAALDVLLLPSWEEPFGRALIEAMALEVPVIATAVGGPPEIITDGCEGFLVEPRNPRAWADAIRRLAGNREVREEMGRHGRLRAEKAFGVDRHVTAMLDVYERTLAREGVRA